MHSLFIESWLLKISFSKVCFRYLAAPEDEHDNVEWHKQAWRSRPPSGIRSPSSCIVGTWLIPKHFWIITYNAILQILAKCSACLLIYIYVYCILGFGRTRIETLYIPHWVNVVCETMSIMVRSVQIVINAWWLPSLFDYCGCVNVRLALLDRVGRCLPLFTKCKKRTSIYISTQVLMCTSTLCIARK